MELSDELIEADAMIEEAQCLMVKARMLEILNGESLRKFQQALITVARQVGDGQCRFQPAGRTLRYRLLT